MSFLPFSKEISIINIATTAITRVWCVMDKTNIMNMPLDPDSPMLEQLEAPAFLSVCKPHMGISQEKLFEGDAAGAHDKGLCISVFAPK